MWQLTSLSDREIVEMILFPALNEAFRIISEGIAFGTSDLDVASVNGMGFPAYRYAFWPTSFIWLRSPMRCWSCMNWSRGGIIFWSNSLGFTYIYSRLDKWSKDYGDFFKPCAYLLERASDGTLLVRNIKLVPLQVMLPLPPSKLHVWWNLYNFTKSLMDDMELYPTLGAHTDGMFGT